jgi:hypothetical protein
MLWGVFAFHQQVRGGWYVLLEVVAAAIVGAAAVLALARSPLLADAAEEPDAPRRPPSPPTALARRPRSPADRG